MKKKIFSIAIAAVMCLSLTMSVTAEDSTEDVHVHGNEFDHDVYVNIDESTEQTADIISIATYSTSYCTVSVPNGICGQYFYNKIVKGAIHEATHEYGGFLGIGKKTCYYKYYSSYFATYCHKGHLQSSVPTRTEIEHDC